MSSQADDTKMKNRAFPWPSRVRYEVGRTRRQRQQQYRQQINVLLITVVVALVAGGMLVYLNWLQAGSIKSVSCVDYPQYCVPLASTGGAVVPVDNEVQGLRTLDGPSEGVEGVVRGLTDDGFPFIGDPDAPVKFAVFADFACPHCQDYHDGDLGRLINDYVLTGQAQYQVAFLTGTGGASSEIASQAALCAGEQGALWEMNDEMYRLAESGVTTLERIESSAKTMGLDESALVSCIASGRYRDFLTIHRNFAQDNGITATPSVLVSINNGPWTQVNRTYGPMSDLITRANEAG